MANNELTYNDFLQRLNIQELLVDAGYQLNKRDGLRYPSYVKVSWTASERRQVHCHWQWQVLFPATRAEELQRDRFHQGASDAV